MESKKIDFLYLLQEVDRVKVLHASMLKTGKLACGNIQGMGTGKRRRWTINI